MKLKIILKFYKRNWKCLLHAQSIFKILVTYITKFPILMIFKCAVLWYNCIHSCYAVSTKICFHVFFITSNSPQPQSLANCSLISVSISVSILAIAYKWNDTINVFENYFLKVFIDLLQYCFSFFNVLVFGCEECRIWSPTRDWTHNYWTIREVCLFNFLLWSFSNIQKSWKNDIMNTNLPITYTE